MTEEQKTQQVARLNDAHRQQAGVGWVMTPGVQALGPAGVALAVAAVRAFEAFGEDNDPYGERDFGAFTIEGQRLFWKIDYYDRGLREASPDPADPAVTRRVLTLMLAEEY